MSAISSSLSVAQRLIHVMDHLGLPKAHFALRHPVELVALLEHAPERVQVPDGVQADPAEVPGGRVAEFQSRVRVRRLVERDREEDDGELDPEIDDLEGETVHCFELYRSLTPAFRRSSEGMGEGGCLVFSTEARGLAAAAKPSPGPAVSINVVPVRR